MLVSLEQGLEGALADLIWEAMVGAKNAALSSL